MRNCRHCGGPIVRRHNEDLSRWKTRVFCGRACSDVGRFDLSDESIKQRFEAQCIPEPNSGCWLWAGALTRGGYGTVTIRGTATRAPRASYALYCAPIPDGTIVRHKCDTPLCVNPEHLELGSHRDNSRDALRRGRHPLGEKHHNAKLSDADVLAIIDDTRPGKVVAKDYGVSDSLIYMVRAGHSRNPT